MKKPKHITQREQARITQGISLSEAAKRAGIGERYLRSIELHGNACFYLAQRLAHIYRCRIDLFR